jgi:hypothetical protein
MRLAFFGIYLFSWGLALTPRAWALQNFRFSGGYDPTTGAVSQASLSPSFDVRWNSLDSARKLVDARHGRLGQCTYADVVPSPNTNLHSYVHGFIYSKSTTGALALRGPTLYVGGTANRQTSGIVLKNSDVFNLLHPGVRSIYSTGSNGDLAGATALNSMKVAADDPCSLTGSSGYVALLASEISLRIAAFEEPQNIVYKKISGEISPKDCAIKTYKAPVFNPGLFLEGASGQSGAVYALRILPEKFCLHHFMTDTTGSITGARLQAQSQFDAAIGLETTIKDLNTPNSSKVIAQLTAPRSTNLIARLFADLDWAQFDTWRDSRNVFNENQTFSGSCFNSPSGNVLRGCSWVTRTSTSHASTCQSDPQKVEHSGTTYWNYLDSTPDQRRLLRLAFFLKDKQVFSSVTPSSFFVGTQARATLDYYSGVTGSVSGETSWTGGDNNFLDNPTTESGFELMLTAMSHSESLAGYSAKVSPRQIEVNRVSEVQSVSFSGSSITPYDSSNLSVTLNNTNADDLDSGTNPPRTLDRLGNSEFATFPGAPSSSNVNYSKFLFSLAAAPPFTSFNPCYHIEKEVAPSAWQPVGTHHDWGWVNGFGSTTSWTRFHKKKYRVTKPGGTVSGCSASMVSTGAYSIVNPVHSMSPSAFVFEIQRGVWTGDSGNNTPETASLSVTCSGHGTKLFSETGGFIRSKLSATQVLTMRSSPGSPCGFSNGGTSQLRVFYQPTSNFFGSDPTNPVYSNGELTSSAFSGNSFTYRATPVYSTGVWQLVAPSAGDAYFEVICAPFGGPI